VQEKKGMKASITALHQKEWEKGIISQVGNYHSDLDSYAIERGVKEEGEKRRRRERRGEKKDKRKGWNEIPNIFYKLRLEIIIMDMDTWWSLCVFAWPTISWWIMVYSKKCK
jgi:hypothetical protein